jgi:hypothetical protein
VPANGGNKAHEHGVGASAFRPDPESALDCTLIATAPKARCNPLLKHGPVSPHGIAMLGIGKNTRICCPSSVGGIERSSPDP